MFASTVLNPMFVAAEQIAAVSTIAIFWIIGPVLNIAFPLYFSFTWIRWYCISYLMAYSLWCYLTQYVPERGGFPLDICRTCWPWTVIRDYFCHTIVKTAELPPDRNYIIGSHPHGVLSIGGTLSYAGKVSGFNELYPGLQQCILTLEGQFRWTFRREVLMFIGANSCSSASLAYLLRNPGKGRAIGLVIGGLSESLMSRPGRYEIKLNDRKGFIKQALEHGADLVPSYHFGETSTYDNARGNNEKLLKNMLARLRNIIGFVPPLIIGDSIPGMWYGGLMPYRRPITTVIGAPIRVEQKENPTTGEIDALHSEYCAALIRLFEENKHFYSIPAHHHLSIY